MDKSKAILLSQQVAAHRATITEYGSNIGKQVFTVTEENTDLKSGQTFREAMSNGVIFLNKACRHYVIHRIDIYKIELALTANDKPVIILNGDSETPITCNIGKPEFDRKVDVASVREAIEHQKNHSNPIYFNDLARLTAEVNRLNNDSEKDLENLIDYISDQKKVYLQDTAMNNAELNKYHTELDGDTEEVISATVTVKEESQEL